MALTPKQASELTREEQEEVKELERKIDDTIRKNFPDYDNRVIFHPPKAIRFRVRKEIERMYEQAGWQVKYESCQRDGEWVELRPRR